MDTINSKPTLTKKDILSINDWVLSDYMSETEEWFIWKYKCVQVNGFDIYMRRRIIDGFTIIEEYSPYNDETKFFEGYIKNLSDLEQITRLCRLREI
jgi:hypothetical protein